jgi:hypothetical protein
VQRRQCPSTTQYASRLHPISSHDKPGGSPPSGSSKGSFFHHFSSKLDLARALAERYTAADLAHLKATLAQAHAATHDPVQRVIAFIRVFEDGAEELMTAQSGCLYVTVLPERQFATPRPATSPHPRRTSPHQSARTAHPPARADSRKHLTKPTEIIQTRRVRVCTQPNPFPCCTMATSATALPFEICGRNPEEDQAVAIPCHADTPTRRHQHKTQITGLNGKLSGQVLGRVTG